MLKVALITGINGQDGSYLVEFLLRKGYYQIHGIIRYSSCTKEQLKFIEEFDSKIQLHYGDMLDFGSLLRIVKTVRPDEIYNLAAQSQQDASFSLQEYTTATTGCGYLKLIEACRLAGIGDSCRIIQPTTSVSFDFNLKPGQPVNEATPHNPRSVYALSKVMTFWLCRVYRQSYSMFLADAICFNHESPRRKEMFASRKISSSVARIKLGFEQSFEMANFHSKLDWGYAKDFVEAMWAILQHSNPDDFVLATGQGHTIRDFCSEAFDYVNMPIEWLGKGDDEQALECSSGIVRIRRCNVGSNTARLAVDYVGDASKASKTLGWKPKHSFHDLVTAMVQNDVDLIVKEMTGESNKF